MKIKVVAEILEALPAGLRQALLEKAFEENCKKYGDNWWIGG